MDQNAKQQIIDRLKEASNVLVTVSSNPSVDQLSACIGFTLLLNKLGKHATAVFSGEIPSTLEFLKPDETIEKNTDSLRDFIIALDKSKADKLRYKVEDKVVKIFITPYRTSITDADLDFSQGDFNVDAVIGLGVHERTDLDKAIMSHGRILHDATVISVNNKEQGSVGSINWVDLTASSLSEMLVGLSHGLTNDPLDAQMATAFMTGVVAETDRFSNAKTSPITMSLASELMTAGANQQLIASKLEVKPSIPKDTTDTSADTGGEDSSAVDDDGALRISHDDTPPLAPTPTPAATLPPVVEAEAEPLIAAPLVPPTPPTPPAPPAAQISKLHDNQLPDTPPTREVPTGLPLSSDNMILQPPSMGGTLTANSEPEHLDPSIDPLSSAPRNGQAPLLGRSSVTPDSGSATVDPKTIRKIEEDIESPHVFQEDLITADDNTTIAPPSAVPGDVVDSARSAVDDAINDASFEQPLEPVASLGAQPLGIDLHDTTPPVVPVVPSVSEPAFEATPAPVADQPQQPPMPYFPPTEPSVIEPSAPAPVTPPFGAPTNGGVDPNIPANLMPSTPITDTTASMVGAPAAPPPVPPPMMPASNPQL